MKRRAFLLTTYLWEYCLVSRERHLQAQLETRDVPTIHSTKLQTEPVWIVLSEVFFLSFWILSLTTCTYSLWYRGLTLHLITHTGHTRNDPSGGGTGPSQRGLSDNTQHSQETRHPCPSRNSNPLFQQSSGHRPAF